MEIFLPIAHMDVNVALILFYGALVGFLSGFVGVGGGFLITPLLIFTGVPPIVAVSSGAAQMAGTAAGASYIQWRYGNIDFKMGAVLLAGGWLGGGIGVLAANILVRSGQFGNVVTLLYVLLLGVIGSYMLVESLRAGRHAASAPAAPEMNALFAHLPGQMTFPASGVRMPVAVPLALGAAVGMMTSLMGVGGGFIMVPAMIYLLRMPTKIVVGTSLFQLLFTTAIVSVMQAGVNQAVDPFLALTLVLGSIFGTRFGADLSRRLPGEKLRLVLALVVVAVAVKMTMTLVIPPADVYVMTVRVHG